MSMKIHGQEYKIAGFDLNRPWGEFYYIHQDDLPRFIDNHFSDLKETIDNTTNISPKILVVNPGKKLSWQYHQRRKEIWSIIKGPVQIIRSFDNEQSNSLIARTDDLIVLEREERHRLIGLDEIAVIAELWVHTNDQLSDELDIIRIEDDYNR